MSMPRETPPIACTLAPGEYMDRMKWIAKLMCDALDAWERRGLALTLRFAPEAAERVRELVRREQTCCGFLTFELRESSTEIRLTIRAPEEARPAVSAIFRQFVGDPRLAHRSRTEDRLR
jgi:hypothetical protein